MGRGGKERQKERREERARQRDKTEGAEKKSKKAEKAEKNEKKTKDPTEAKQVPRTLESKRVFDAEQIMDAETLAAMDATDEFASFFVDGKPSKILVSTTRGAQKDTCHFAEELSDLFPGAEYRKRLTRVLVADMVKAANERDFTHIVIVNESRGTPNTLSIVKLPQGPTALFQLTSIKTGKQIHNHGRSSSHTPELILNNFTTRLGHRLGRLFVSLFPHVPQFQGRQVVTFHNQRDFVFVRRHRYVFEEGRRVRLQEIGPQFTLKLAKIYRDVCHLQQAEVEYEWRPHAIDRHKFAL